VPYSGNPADSTADAVWFLLGDTTATPDITAAEIAWLISEYGTDPVVVAYYAAQSLVNKFAKLVDQKVGKVWVYYSQRLSNYQSLVATLKLRMETGVGMYAGGISLADIETEEEDTDRPDSWFEVGMMDDPASEASDG